MSAMEEGGDGGGRTQGLPVAGDSVITCALKVLLEGDAEAKAAKAAAAYALWSRGLVPVPPPGMQAGLAPARPASDDAKVRLLTPGQMPRRGKGGSLASRQALLHSLVHIECCAIDLAFDLIARFGTDPAYAPLPPSFFDDFMRVGADEARHFSLLLARLRETGSDYGAHPAHAGLWESAEATSRSLPARLAVEHCCHEARGVDILPQTIRRFRAAGDAASADLLEHVVYVEEISHCAAGVRWLRYLYERAWGGPPAEQAVGRRGGDSERPAEAEAPGSAGGGSDRPAEASGSSGGSDATWVLDARAHPTVEGWFHSLVRRHFYGPLKPPFNEAARAQAGFEPAWYLPLAAP